MQKSMMNEKQKQDYYAQLIFGKNYNELYKSNKRIIDEKIKNEGERCRKE